jgi:hypothetical protein
VGIARRPGCHIDRGDEGWPLIVKPRQRVWVRVNGRDRDTRRNRLGPGFGLVGVE